MFDFNRINDIKWLLDDSVEMGDGNVLFWKNEFGYQFEFWKNSNENVLGGLDKKIEEECWEVFKTKVTNYFLGVDEK